MAFSVARITVRDFDEWLPDMEGFADMRKDAGSRGSKVFQSADDKNELAVLQEWDSLEQARAFGGSPALAAAMKQAGVLDFSEMLYVESALEFEF